MAEELAVPFFNLSRIALEESEQLHKCLDVVIASGQFIGGSSVSNFENQFARETNSRHCVGVANGLDAIRIMLESFGLTVGDEIIVPAFTYYATWLAAAQVGLKLVPVDVCQSTAALDPEHIEASITSKTRAILVVSLFGIPADFPSISRIAQAHGLFLFHDAAQCHGATTPMGIVGSIGDATAFSFYPTKNLGAFGDAGGITTSNSTAHSIMLSRRSYGQGLSKYDHVDTGWNSRLDPIQAEFLQVHLGKLPAWNSKRRSIAERYLIALGTRASAVLGNASTDSVWHHFVILASDRERLRGYFEANGIGTDIHYPYSINDIKPLSKHLAKGLPILTHPVSEMLSKSVTSIPMGPWMTDVEVNRVSEVLSRIPSGLLAGEV